jgi:hypothetical protein
MVRIWTFAAINRFKSLALVHGIELQALPEQPQQRLSQTSGLLTGRLAQQQPLWPPQAASPRVAQEAWKSPHRRRKTSRWPVRGLRAPDRTELRPTWGHCSKGGYLYAKPPAIRRNALC